jgi:hypothetical protein
VVSRRRRQRPTLWDLLFRIDFWMIRAVVSLLPASAGRDFDSMRNFGFCKTGLLESMIFDLREFDSEV